MHGDRKDEWSERDYKVSKETVQYKLECIGRGYSPESYEKNIKLHFNKCGIQWFFSFNTSGSLGCSNF